MQESGIVMVEKLWDITPDEMRSFCVSELEDYFMSGSTRRILEAIRMVARPGLNAHIVECLITEGIVRDVTSYIEPTACQLYPLPLSHATVTSVLFR
jgi:hypothetical protein